MRLNRRALVAGFVVGLTSLGAAYGGTVIAPPRHSNPTPDIRSSNDVARSAGFASASGSSRPELRPADVAAVLRSKIKAPARGRTPAGTFLVGGARVGLAPAPKLFGGRAWMREGCTSIEGGNVDGDHLLPPVDDPVDEIRSWPASSPDCVYLGGFGIGPVRPAERVGPGGVWIRALAISNGRQTFIYTIADLVGWFARYDSTICSDCGIRDVRERVARDLGTSPGTVVVASTHSHATADTYGGWGAYPTGTATRSATPRLQWRSRR